MYYKLDSTSIELVLKDVLKRVQVTEESRNNIALYYDYLVKDGERPEHISDKIYDRSDYHWIILLMNGITDPFFGWPLSEDQFEKYILKKYPDYALMLNTSEGNLGFEEGHSLTQAGAAGIVQSWDPTMAKVVASLSSGAFATGALTDVDTSVVATVTHTMLNTHAPHHYVNSFGDTVVRGYDDSVTFEYSSAVYDYGTSETPIINSVDKTGFKGYVSNYEYEQAENQRKRLVKLLRPELVAAFIREFQTRMNSQI